MFVSSPNTPVPNCSYHPDWIAIRASFGMNGIFIQDRDVLPFAGYLEKHQKRRPPDHGGERNMRFARDSLRWFAP